MLARLAALFVGLWAIAPALADPADQYESKVRALAHPRYAEREKAARELEAAGEKALKALRAVRTSKDEELRARAAAVEARIDRVVRSKRLLAAPTLSLKFDSVPIDQAVAALASKTGLPLQLDRTKGLDPKRTVTLDTGEVPFWQAVHAFYEAAGLTEADTLVDGNAGRPTGATVDGRGIVIYRYPSARPANNRLLLIDGPAPIPAATGHALRVRALPANFAQNRFDAEKGEFTLHLDVDKVPTLNLQEVFGVEIRRATTPDRQALVPMYPPALSSGFDLGDMIAARQVIILQGELQIDGTPGGPYYPVTLKTHGERPRLLAELEGVVVARVLTPPEPLATVADVFGKGKLQPHVTDGFTCTVTGTEQVAEHPLPLPRVPAAGGNQPPERPPVAGEAPGSIRVQLKWTNDSTSDVMNFPVQLRGRPRAFLRIDRGNRRSGLNGPEFQLKDADGKPVRLLGMSGQTIASEGNTITQELVLTFEKPARGLDGLSLTVTGSRSAVVELPFVLKDVPLP